MYHLDQEKLEELQCIIASLLGQSHILLLIRGIPGMGKSYLGKYIADQFDAIQLETDQQFMTAGEYVFDITKIEDAHTITQNETKNLMIDDAALIIVSNTFTMNWEMESYQALAAKYSYTCVIYDVFLQLLDMFPNLKHKNRQSASQKSQKHADRELNEYLDYLCMTNAHSVPREAIQAMSDRYEFSSQGVTIIRPPEERFTKETSDRTSVLIGEDTNKHRRGPPTVAVIDTGYYLALDILPPEDSSEAPAVSMLYHQCMQACHDILEIVGIATGSHMIKRVVNRNAASHGRAIALSTGNTHSRNPAKLAAGCGRFHITVLGPAEYSKLNADANDGSGSSSKKRTYKGGADGLQSSSTSRRMREFKQQLSSIILDDIVLTASTSGGSGDSLAIGMVSGPISDRQTIAGARVDAHGVRAGLSATEHSTALYLLCNRTTSRTMQAVDELRSSYGLSNAEYHPHITLAFTHNDIHSAGDGNSDTANAAADGSDDFDKGAEIGKKQVTPVKGRTKGDRGKTEKDDAGNRYHGVERFQQLRAQYRRHSHDDDAVTVSTAAGAAATTLATDKQSLHYVMLLLHTETNVTFNPCFDFMVADLKIRRTPIGDDAIYKTFRLLQSYLPRGCVFIQHCPPSSASSSSQGCRCMEIYKGLFSLRKFYGKEGMEDDGAGYAEDQLRFKLQRVLQGTTDIVLMEKVNGRAGSARFFNMQGVSYLLIGTKLSHVVCRLDCEAHKIVPPEWLSVSDEGGGDQEVASDSETEGQENDDEDAAAAVTTTVKLPVSIANQLFEKNKLLLSNITGFANVLQWDNVRGFVSFLGGRTVNGEVLDPEEMHLVALDRHEWVSLCVTDFPPSVLIAPYTETGIVGSDQSQSEGAGESAVDGRDTIQLLQTLSQFVTSIPAYTVFPLVHPEDGSELSLPEKRAEVDRIARSVTFMAESEGKVMYFIRRLPAPGSGTGSTTSEVLELLKYKTWWYVWRRSVREITNKLFMRLKHLKDSTSDSKNCSSSGSDNKKGKKKSDTTGGPVPAVLSAKLDRLRAQLRGMESSTKNKNNDIDFQIKLQQCKDDIAEVEGEHQVYLDVARRESELRSSNETVTAQLIPLVEQLCTEIRNKWPSKFNFMRNELAEEYSKNVTAVIVCAQAFLKWVLLQVSLYGLSGFMRDFKRYFPVVWNRFLEESALVDRF